MSERLAARWAGFGTSVFTEMTQLARAHGAVNLAQGFPDFHGPAALLDALERQVRTSHHQYAPGPGEERLRRAVAGFVGLDHDPLAETTITSGATEALYAAINALVNPGDRVVVIEPAYDSYPQAIAQAGGVPVPVALHPDRDLAAGAPVGSRPLPRHPTRLADGPRAGSVTWRLDLDELDAAVAGGFRVLLLNTPHNPTGKVFDAAELARIADAVRAADAVAITDEVYEALTYDGVRHLSLASMPGMRDRVIRISSAAKTFGFTGFKVGWASAPEPLTRALRLVHQAIVFATPPLLQTAIAEVLEDAGWMAGYLAELRASYQAKRDLLAGALVAAGFEVPPVSGAYFLMARYPGARADVAEARHLIETRGVAAIPPSAFYLRRPAALPWLRFAFCKRDETLARAASLLTALDDRAQHR
jgi:aspartate/methionine/tyrosine aminotransferase